MSIDTLREERDFLKKSCMVYQKFLNRCYPGYLDHYADGMVDALLTWWKTSELSWEHADRVVTEWLNPTIHKILKGIGKPK